MGKCGELKPLENQQDLGSLLRLALHKSIKERRKMTTFFLEMALLDLEGSETPN